MTAERRKILTMLHEHKIDVDEAEGLLDALQHAPEPPPTLNFRVITNHPPLLKTLDDARKAASSNVPILIVGEPGTGKVLMGRIIHQASPRQDKPFIAVSCAIAPETLLESDLFGHERGAFTGAVQRKIGQIEGADGGTLCLDEIERLTLNSQGKLLRFMHSGEFERVGGSERISADVRIVALSHLGTQELAKRLERHLFETLSVITLELTPLRERKDDIPLLVDHFLAERAKEHNRAIPTITPEAMDALMAYDWPSNVRELVRAIERAVVLCDEATIGVKHLPNALVEAVQRTSSMKQAEVSET
ncbi:sigma-54-dependent Fis family transcriptional regulator [Candidatus Poribacteria bacterium]|nr:sigma-54-dependent Fis family transcriptional regulator [Candidatus Poribacteria bacterium]